MLYRRKYCQQLVYTIFKSLIVTDYSDITLNVILNLIINQFQISHLVYFVSPIN